MLRSWQIRSNKLVDKLERSHTVGKSQTMDQLAACCATQMGYVTDLNSMVHLLSFYRSSSSVLFHSPRYDTLFYILFLDNVNI